MDHLLFNGWRIRPPPMDLIDEKALFLLRHRPLLVKRLAGPPSDGHTERNLFGNTVPVLQSIYAPFTHTYANTFTHISSGFLVIFRHVVYKYFIRLFFQMNHKWTSILSRVKELFGPRSTLPVLVSFTPLCAVCTVSSFFTSIVVHVFCVYRLPACVSLFATFLFFWKKCSKLYLYISLHLGRRNKRIRKMTGQLFLLLVDIVLV